MRCTLLLMVILWSAGLAGLANAGDTTIAAAWQPRESKQLRNQIDAAVLKYAEALDNKDYSAVGARTLQALGLVAALPRLKGKQQEDYLAKAKAVVEAERADYWPGGTADATDRAKKLHGNASYHLPLVLLLFEHQQAGALEVGSKAASSRDREMRFGVVPAKGVRADVVRLLAILLATGYGQQDGLPNEFDGLMQDGKIWSYSSFGKHAASCISPTGMAAIGLSAAVFGLNVLDYDPTDYEIAFGGRALRRNDIRNRIVDVCAHLIFSLVRFNHLTNVGDLKELTADTRHLDADAFRIVTAPGANGETLIQLQASKADLDASKHNLGIYHYRSTNDHRGGYYSACAAFALTTAARVLAFVLEHEAKEPTLGKQYEFKREPTGTWRLAAAGGWAVEIIPEINRRYCPLRFTQAGKPLDIDSAIIGALNTCVACMTVPVGKGGEARSLRAANSLSPQEWMQGASSAKSHVSEFAGLHAFAFYKAAVVTGDGDAIGRWLAWQDMAQGLAREPFVSKQIDATKEPQRKAAALAFSIMTLTRTYRPIFPKSMSK